MRQLGAIAIGCRQRPNNRKAALKTGSRRGILIFHYFLQMKLIYLYI
jgi:hypothetical protein